MHSRLIDLKRIHPFGIMTGIVLDKKEINTIEKATAGKANKGSYRHKGWKGIFCGYTDDDLKTPMIYIIRSNKIKCCAYDNCR